MHFPNFLKKFFEKFRKVFPPEKNPGYAHANTYIKKGPWVSDVQILFFTLHYGWIFPKQKLKQI